jgi:hypothetical protein
MIEVCDGYENMQKDYENFLRVEEGGGPFLGFTSGRNPSSAWDFTKNQGIFLWM